MSDRGTAVIDATTKVVELEAGKSHTFQLTSDGEMVFRLDGAELIRTRDRRLNGAFDNMLLINGGGDYTIGSVAVYGNR